MEKFCLIKKKMTEKVNWKFYIPKISDEDIERLCSFGLVTIDDVLGSDVDFIKEMLSSSNFSPFLKNEIMKSIKIVKTTGEKIKKNIKKPRLGDDGDIFQYCISFEKYLKADPNSPWKETFLNGIMGSKCCDEEFLDLFNKVDEKVPFEKQFTHVVSLFKDYEKNNCFLKLINLNFPNERSLYVFMRKMEFLSKNLPHELPDVYLLDLLFSKVSFDYIEGIPGYKDSHSWTFKDFLEKLIEISEKKPKCFKCLRVGHIAKNCKSQTSIYGKELVNYRNKPVTKK